MGFIHGCKEYTTGFILTYLTHSCDGWFKSYDLLNKRLCHNLKITHTVETACLIKTSTIDVQGMIKKNRFYLPLSIKKRVFIEENLKHKTTLKLKIKNHFCSPFHHSTALYWKVGCATSDSFL